MEKIVVILHINGARAILLLLCDHQDTEYEECVMDSGVAGPILTNKKSKVLCDKDIHTLQDG